MLLQKVKLTAIALMAYLLEFFALGIEFDELVVN